MRTRRQRPASVIVPLSGWPHRIDLRAMNLAFYRGLVAGRWLDLGGLAEASKLSRSTVNRFMTGGPVSIATARALLAVLELNFNEVAVLVGDEELPD